MPRIRSAGSRRLLRFRCFTVVVKSRMSVAVLLSEVGNTCQGISVGSKVRRKPPYNKLSDFLIRTGPVH